MQRISTQLTGPLPVATQTAPPLPPRKATAEKKEKKDKADKKEKKEKKQKNRLRLSTSKLPAITAPAAPLSVEDEWLESYLNRAMDVRQRLAQFREETRGLVGRASGYLFEVQLYDDVQQQEEAALRDLASHTSAYRELDAVCKTLLAQCVPPAKATGLARDCWTRASEHVTESQRMVKSELCLAEGEIRKLIRDRRRWILTATAPDLSEQRLKQLLDADTFEVFPSTAQ